MCRSTPTYISLTLHHFLSLGDGCNLLDFDLFDDGDAQKEQAAWRFEMRDRTQPEVLLGNELQLNIIELKKADRLGISAETLNAWITFFEHWQEDALMASITHEPIKKAMNRIKLLSASEEEKRLALVRERALHDEATLMHESREEGLEEAREEARQKTAMAVMNLIKLGLPDEQIAEAFQIGMEELQTIKDEYLH